jgi:hypothetical protein
MKLVNLITFSLLFLTLNVFGIEVDSKYDLDIRYFACDSTGVEKTAFKTDEAIYFGCTVKNVSDQPVIYTKMQFNPPHKPSRFLKEMFYVVCLKDDGTRPKVGYEDSPPPGTKWVEFTLKPDETLSQIQRYYPPERLKSGVYRAWFSLNYIFKDAASNIQDEMSNTIRIEVE